MKGEVATKKFIKIRVMLKESYSLVISTSEVYRVSLKVSSLRVSSSESATPSSGHSAENKNKYGTLFVT